jgi:nucleoid-associated protein YgaU
MPAPAPRIAIDAVEVDTGTAYIAGEGPAEATMRLYVNGTPVGDSTVTEGRWFVSGPGLLSAPRAELRVEARDSTGRIVGEGRLTIEMAAPPPPAPLKPLSEPDPRPPSLPSAAPLPQSEPLLRGPAVTAPVRQPVDARPAPEPELAVMPVVVQLAPSRVEPARRLSFGKAIIRPGDTLWGLARRYYGTGAAYGTIYRANRDLIDHPGRIFPGQVLEVPLVLDE